MVVKWLFGSPGKYNGRWDNDNCGCEKAEERLEVERKKNTSLQKTPRTNGNKNYGDGNGNHFDVSCPREDVRFGEDGCCWGNFFYNDSLV
jgi:hypothetical protein